jgi:pilus assembly protein FimV
VSAVSAAWGGISTAEPTWHAGPVATAAVTATPVAADAVNAGQQLELARAYLDMGDDNAARELLRDVLDGRDPAARAEAARLLRDL